MAGLDEDSDESIGEETDIIDDEASDDGEGDGNTRAACASVDASVGNAAVAASSAVEKNPAVRKRPATAALDAPALMRDATA